MWPVLALFGAVALMLAGVGIYGVVSFTVVRMTREIGIRLALGADPIGLRNRVVRSSMATVLVGVTVGTLLATGMSRILSNLLFEVSAVDPLVFLAVIVVLGVVGLAASFLPAVQATKVDPMVTMRAE